MADGQKVKQHAIAMRCFPWQLKLTEMIRKFRGATQLDPGISWDIGPCPPHIARWWAARSMPWVRGKTISGTPWRFRWPLPPSSGPWPSWETSQASLGEWFLIAMGPRPRCAWAPAARPKDVLLLPSFTSPKVGASNPLEAVALTTAHGMVLGCLSIGYCLIGVALVSGLGKELKVLLASLGSLLAGYSSVSLLDNITCMACSISFPQNRAAAVGYLKAVLATAGGLWALLWVQVRLVFDTQSGLGLCDIGRSLDAQGYASHWLAQYSTIVLLIPIRSCVLLIWDSSFNWTNVVNRSNWGWLDGDKSQEFLGSLWGCWLCGPP